MSNKGIFTALSGAVAQSSRLDTLSNNIANVNTPGFKRDEQVFKEYLSAYEKAPDVIQVPKVPASIESFYDMQGGDRGYVDKAGTFTNFEQGALKPTNNRLDVALSGKGLMEVMTPAGVRYTRNGSFTLNAQGQLVTKSGFFVLRAGNEPPEARYIDLTDQDITFSSNGGVFQGGEEVANLSLVVVDNNEALEKMGGSLYSLRENYNAVVTPSQETTVHQGFLENSNVNIIREMTDLIQATRTFESTQKAIQAYDQINDKLVNTVPTTR